MSGLVAFDDDSKVALRDLRTVAQLEQLHGRVAADVTSDPFRCPIMRATQQIDQASFSGMPPERAVKLSQCIMDRMRRTVAWEQRHEQTLTMLFRPWLGGRPSTTSDGKDSPVVRASNERSDLTTRPEGDLARHV